MDYSAACRSIVEIPGHLYTVNPIAVNSPMCNVFTENKRVRVQIRTEDFGVVQFVAIGATAVGSINFTVTSGGWVKKGDELGYFAFGGSTCITIIHRKRVDLHNDLCQMSCKSVETYIRMGDAIGCAKDATTSLVAKPASELPGQVMQQASTYSAAKIMDMQNLVRSIMDSRSRSDDGCDKTSSAMQRWSYLRQSTLQNKAFVSLLTDANDTKAQEALENTEAVGGTVEVDCDSDSAPGSQV
eukprot:jgi/Ulvmu1/7904/UM004_0136.1